ncbi:MAG TPA: DUF6364 family protein [Gammaproteobacteria bacterium]|nr:DUF6364 family protein [Gammaproteobacteria bacterium]
MTTKLTLRLNKALIKRAKSYARQNETSVSQLVSDYFAILDYQVDAKPSLSLPLTNSLRGALKGSRLSEKDYKEHLHKKYL